MKMLRFFAQVRARQNDTRARRVPQRNLRALLVGAEGRRRLLPDDNPREYYVRVARWACGESSIHGVNGTLPRVKGSDVNFSLT